MISYVTSGESHGRGMFVTVSGVPSNLSVDLDAVNRELSRRQSGYGRGGRMKIETDRAEILSGVTGGKTTGAPVTMAVWNADYENWKNARPEPVLKPRPGHADLTGSYKFGLKDDIRKVLERSSARETAARVSAGALVRQILTGFGIEIFSHVVRWGEIAIDTAGMDLQDIRGKAEKSDLRSACDPATEDRVRQMIDKTRSDGNTVGGVVEVVIAPVPPFLGSYQHYAEKLDSRIAATVLSVQAVKGIEFGLGFQYGSRTGRETHDEIFFDRKKNTYYRQTNNAGGIEGGMSNGNPIVFRAVMKPIPTLLSPLRTVRIDTREPDTAATERSDVAAVAACGVVLENAVAVDIANALIARYGGDDLELIRKNFNGDPALSDFHWRSDHA